jgi:glutamate 5-kinase
MIGLIAGVGIAATAAGGGSLLPVGVVAVSGNFRRGDVVSVLDANGKEFGRGLAEYSSDEATLIAGCQSEQIEDRLGYRGRSVMLHHNELVLFANVR